uniref:Uncharacterized protein n=1 Tax=Molossus molossus TaxID=27622 RepID=A0A7J8DPN7_MOLMO|nr:hypothetical protein HJG59_009245 [Molossus molossus]
MFYELVLFMWGSEGALLKSTCSSPPPSPSLPAANPCNILIYLLEKYILGTVSDRSMYVLAFKSLTVDRDCEPLLSTISCHATGKSLLFSWTVISRQNPFHSLHVVKSYPVFQGPPLFPFPGDLFLTTPSMVLFS